jgi:hypothetical protein
MNSCMFVFVFSNEIAVKKKKTTVKIWIYCFCFHVFFRCVWRDMNIPTNGGTTTSRSALPLQAREDRWHIAFLASSMSWITLPFPFLLLVSYTIQTEQDVYILVLPSVKGTARCVGEELFNTGRKLRSSSLPWVDCFSFQGFDNSYTVKNCNSQKT